MQSSVEILVVDDAPANLKVITDILASAEYKVTIATTGERAIKRLKQPTPNLPNLILLDVRMPGIDGFETCKRIKSDPDLCHLPIIFLTALSDTESTIKGFELGAVDYIGKPFREPELLARVKTHIQLQQLTQHLEQQVAERTEALTQAMQELQTSELQLIQHAKMSTLGDLVASIGHEINNPLAFVNGNISVLNQYFDNVLTYLQLYEEAYLAANEFLIGKREELEIDYVLNDINALFSSAQTGCDRIHDISKSLRIFSREDMETKVKTNIHEGLDSTLHILSHRLKTNEHRPDIQVIRNYGNSPDIPCFPGQLNHAFMNILANAVDMFDEVATMGDVSHLIDQPQVISVGTAVVSVQDTDHLEITISDNGKGMSEDVCCQIFERGFTTKGVGKGTGLGLAIARRIVVDVHAGTLDVQSEIGKGSTFSICLPMA